MRLKNAVQQLRAQVDALTRKNESLQYTVSDLSTQVHQERWRRFDVERKLNTVRQQSGGLTHVVCDEAPSVF